jgi:hypothetical protein
VPDGSRWLQFHPSPGRRAEHGRSAGFQNGDRADFGPIVFKHACKLGLEGIVSKRKDSRYHSGRWPHWIKSKNPNAPAVKREAEEDWRQWKG